jgi:arylsulfatase A-like enzyme
VPKRAEGKSADGPYGDAVEYLDGTVGQVMETLDKLGLADNTLVVFNSDNGPLWKRAPELERIYRKYGTVDTSRPHLLQGGKYVARWEGGTRVPMIARWPGKIPAGRTSDLLAAGFDLFTTFAHVAGVQIPTDRIIDGKDILPLLESEADVKSPHDALYYYQDFDLAAVRGPTWKLIFPNMQDKRTLLFDVQNDPGEKSDRLAEHGEIVEQLRKTAEKAREDLGDNLTKRPGKNRRPAGHAGE